MNMPIKPDEADCCGSGCNPCIFDIYEEQLKLYYKKCSSDLEESPSEANNCISQTSYSVFQLTNIEKDSEDTNTYTFKFIRKCKPDNEDNNNYRLIFKPGQHCSLRGNGDKPGIFFTRPYSVHPSRDRDKLSFMVLIKILAQGQMSTFIDKFKIGDETYWRGPYGNFEINYKLKHILMIAQGTGIAPIYTVLKKIIENENCETFLKLFFCCKSHDHIHFRNELNEMASNWNFTYNLFLSDNGIHTEKKYRESIQVRKLVQDDIQEYCNSKNCDINFQVLICGSDEFAKNMFNYCKKSGVKDEFIHTF